MALLTGIKHIFFDLDDTLWDYETNSATVLAQLYEEFGLEERLKADFNSFLPRYRQVNHEMWLQYAHKEITKQQLRDERFSETFRHFNYKNSGLNAELTRAFLQRTPQEKCLKDGCHEVLASLKKNYGLHIITNGFNDVQFIKIRNGNIGHYFSNIIVSEDHALSKPDVAIFKLAEQLASALPHECAMVGDTFESDIIGAEDAGWKTVYYSKKPATSFTGLRIGNLRELLEIFEVS